MNKAIIPALFLTLASLIRADDGFERNKDFLDRNRYERAPLVVRTWVLSAGKGSKYLWAETVIHGIMKMPKNAKVSPMLKVAYRSDGQGIPIGDVTLYLEPYHPEKPELGWKLIERFNKETKKYSKGYSHHYPETTAEQNAAEQPSSRSAATNK